MAVEHVYPAGPSAVPPDLTRPSKAYRAHAWLAMAGLLAFIVLYLALAGWFSWTAYRLLLATWHGSSSFWGLLAGVGSAFLAVFMWKALFFVQNRHAVDGIEITASDQPRLFAFINRLADEAGAPRAHRVFLSPRVNAAVFYELTALNLLFPSRKNLEIGLGLVNAISLGELKAVLAHEFGHFGQRSMAVDRWVYVAHQIAGAIISKRDALDSFLRGLSGIDVRIAWVGWLLSLIVWSIRSLMETVFRVVVLAQRALSREMELQADLVAVSLTGSDALIHALHRLSVADEAWDRTLGFTSEELHAKRSVGDLFAVQAHITAKLRQVLDDPTYGEVEPLPKDRPEEHRVFKSSLGQPPRMWSTHPANSEREQNAKRRYIPAPIDSRSAWELFDDMPHLRKQMTAHVQRAVEDTVEVPMEDTLARLDEQYRRAYFDPAYRGAYLGRLLTIHARDAAELYGSTPIAERIAVELAAIYPENLAQDLERLRELEEEKQLLQGLKEGFLTAPGGIIRHRGKDLKRAELKGAIEQVDKELNKARAAVHDHDRRCRSAHLAAAAQLGAGWDAYLKGLASVLHYAEHSEANLRDAHGALCNVVAIVTADRRVSGKERQRLLQACAEMHIALRHIYDDEGRQIALDRTLLRRLKVESWQEALGPFGLPLANEQNLGEWLKAIDSWVASAGSALAALRQGALEQLLLVEAQVSRFARENMTPGAAPTASRVPGQYPLLLPNTERPRQKKLDLWDRFHVADGVVATLARLTVACGIIAAVLSVAATVGATLVTIKNGLGRPVMVSIGDASIRVEPYAYAQIDVGGDEQFTVKTSTEQGELIEQFEVAIPSGSENSIYNVAGASLLIEWTASYGSAAPLADRSIGPIRWTTSNADHVFEQPPEQISTSSSEGGTRKVIDAVGHDNPGLLLAVESDEGRRAAVIETHARWDSSNTRGILYWLDLASRGDSFQDILRARLASSPNDVLTLRVEQDYASTGLRAVVCKRHRTMAGAAPNDMDLQYVAARCIDDEQQRGQAFADLFAKAPTHPWLALGVSYTHMQHARWNEALAPLDLARRELPALQERLALDTLRVRRMLDGEAKTSDLAGQSDAVKYQVSVRSGAGLQPGTDMAYYALGRGMPAVAAGDAKRNPEVDRRVVRFAAASDNASREMVAAGLQMPVDEGIDNESVWSALALALRERRDPAPYVAAIRKLNIDRSQEVLDFVTAVRTSTDRAQAESLLEGLPIELRGQAYSAAVVLLGPRAPVEWRRGAQRLLFPSERPYFASAAQDGANDVVRTQPSLR